MLMMSEEQVYYIEQADKRRRSLNMLPAERLLLAELFLKYQSTLDNKKTDAQAVSMKEQAWQSLAIEFQETSSSGIQREWQQLKKAYENMKSRAKKAPSHAKVKRRKTEGDTFISQVDDMDEKLMALLGNGAKLMVKVCDEAPNESFDGESVIYLASPNEDDTVVPDETFHELSNKVSVAASSMSTSAPVEQVVNVRPIVSRSVRLTQTRSTAAEQAANVQPSYVKKIHQIRPAAVPQSAVNAEPDVRDKVQRTRQRSSNFHAGQDCSPLNSMSSIRSNGKDVMARPNIDGDDKNDYYRSVLDMRRIEHEKRMTVLGLKELYYSRKIQKLNAEELRAASASR